MDATQIFSAEYAAIITQIQANFEDNLNRQFENDIARESHNCTLSRFQNISCNHEQSTIQFRNFRVSLSSIHTHVGVHLLDQCFALNIRLHNLHIDADICIIERDECSSVNGNARDRLALHADNVHFTGRVGFYNREDSLVPLNYDLDVPASEMKAFQVEVGSVKVSQDVKEKMRNICWIQVKEWLMRRIDRLLSGCVVEFSFGELFLDEPGQYKKYQQQRVTVANTLFNEHMQNLTDMCTPTVYRKLHSCFIHNDMCYLIDIDECKISNLKTLASIRDASFVQQGDQLVAFVDAAMSEIKCEFINCTLTRLGEEHRQYSGDVIVVPTRNRIKILFDVKKHNATSTCHLYFDIVQLEIDDLKLDVPTESIADFTSCLDELLPIMVGYTRQYLNKTLEDFLQLFNAKYST